MKEARYPIHPGAALLGVLLLLVGVALSAGCAARQPAQDPIAGGKASYEHYCQSCHGLDGHGLGQLVSDLKTLPTDLTELSLRNRGTFPAETVYQAIDGRQTIPAHGTREMPIWGNIWGYNGDVPAPQEAVDQRINELVEYIRSIQETS